MKRTLLAAGFGLVLTGGAQATGTVSCTGDGASVHLGLGTVPGLAVISADLSGDGTVLSMAEGEIAVAQAFADIESIRIDFTDANIEGFVARLRLFRASEANDDVMAGTLSIVGVGAWTVTCEGP